MARLYSRTSIIGTCSYQPTDAEVEGVASIIVTMKHAAVFIFNLLLSAQERLERLVMRAPLRSREFCHEANL
jgi:hypothetical protein